MPSRPRYQLSRYGRIRSTTTDEILNLRIIFGYFSFEYTDCILKEKKAKFLHVLMAAHWLKNYDPVLNTVHLDHDKFNNYYRNLTEVTAGERAHRVVENGRNKNFKLTEAVMRQIKSSKDAPGQLAQRFGVSVMQVQRVQCGDCWSHGLPKKTRARQSIPTMPPGTVAKIKALLNEGVKGKTIASRLNVTETTVSRIGEGTRTETT